jgi:hypothetical protein
LETYLAVTKTPDGTWALKRLIEDKRRFTDFGRAQLSLPP